ncbi:subclass B3 metallo-beta-lactamase [Pedobacter sp. L105]|uniref:subclass B3 metallo-beta-lactamase n=1 Tax=Pedobacter sp. L105 TaxID=1641871 RepID=UPI00131DD406|nr:subclass B3 metallo-beta-lactamase [Pedobacter sp. L105]
MSIFKKLLQITLLITGLMLCYFCSSAQKLISIPTQKDWSREEEPFRIAGNLYYVGTYDLACYLITTPKGNILINTGLAGSAPMIRRHIEKLGFRFSDTKILLATHAHFDHVGALAEIKKQTGAKVMINEKDAPVLADGGNSDFIFGGKGSSFAPVKADRLLHEQDTVRFGGMQLIVLHHPGHTKGACSFLFDVKDGHRSYRVLIANMPSILDETKLAGMPTYPNVGKDYAYTLKAMKKLQFDIWLASHASQFNMHHKHKAGDPYHPEVFMDRAGYDTAINDLQKDYQKKLAEQRNQSGNKL